MSTFYRINDQYEIPLGSPRIVITSPEEDKSDFGLMWFLKHTSGVHHPDGLFWRLYRREDKTDHYSLSTYRASLGEEIFLIEDVPLLTIASYLAKFYRERTGRGFFALEDMPYASR